MVDTPQFVGHIISLHCSLFLFLFPRPAHRSRGWASPATTTTIERFIFIFSFLVSPLSLLAPFFFYCYSSTAFSTFDSLSRLGRTTAAAAAINETTTRTRESIQSPNGICDMESISYVNPSPTRPLSRRIVDCRAQRSAQNRRLFPFLVFFF